MGQIGAIVAQICSVFWPIDAILIEIASILPTVWMEMKQTDAISVETCSI